MAKPRSLFRDITGPDIVKAFDIMVDTQMEVLQGLDRISKEILKDHLLDKNSISYFTWLRSTLQQLRSTLEPQWITAKEKEKVEMLALPKMKRERKKRR